MGRVPQALFKSEAGVSWEEGILSRLLAKYGTLAGEGVNSPVHRIARQSLGWLAGEGSVAHSSRSFSWAWLVVVWDAVFLRLGLPPPKASPSPRQARARKWIQK